jgi:gamma-glutamyltranspeptidase/glutathione hydrolase
MTRRIFAVALCSVLITHFLAAQEKSAPRPRGTPPPKDIARKSEASGAHGAVVAGGAEAVAAGMEMFKTGGNAADAAAATILAQSVTDADQFCFGGEVPILVYNARRRVVEALSGMGTAPRLATREYFRKKGGIPASGKEAAAVPAALGVCVTLLDRHGTKTFAEAVAPALRILDRHGQAWHANLARTLRRLVEAEQAGAGDRDRGLRLVADCFYRGSVARDLDAWSRANGGLLRFSDLATHITRVEEPASATYRGYTVRPPTVATPSTSAARGRKARICWRRYSSWKGST